MTSTMNTKSPGPSAAPTDSKGPGENRDEGHDLDEITYAIAPERPVKAYTAWRLIGWSVFILVIIGLLAMQFLA